MAVDLSHLVAALEALQSKASADECEALVAEFTRITNEAVAGRVSVVGIVLEAHNPLPPSRIELKQLREEAKLTQVEVVERAGWSLSKLIRIETNKVGISPGDLWYLLNIYRVTDEVTISRLKHMLRVEKEEKQKLKRKRAAEEVIAQADTQP